MRTRDDRGAAAPEYIAILLIPAMFTSCLLYTSDAADE